MDLASVVDPPVRCLVGGVMCEFPRLESVETKVIAATIKDMRHATNERGAAIFRLTPWERFRAYQELEYEGVGMPDLLRYARTQDGADTVLAASSKKAGRSDAEHAALMKALHMTFRSGLAVELLSAADEKPPQKKAEEARPLDSSTPNQSAPQT
jgi:hypothetical protein